MQPLRLGIVGTGVAARELHWPALKQMPDCYRIVAVANRGREKAERFADMVGLDRSAVYTEYRQLLNRGDIDVVDLALPPELNPKVAQAAAETGIHVICEKPIAAKLEQAHMMALIPEQFGVQLLIAENFRYDNAVRQARDLLDEGQLSPPFMLSYEFVQPVPPGDEIASRPWRQQPSHPGGIFSDHGVHMIDITRFLMGEIAEVHVLARDLRDHLVGMDTAVYNLRFSSGAIGSIQWSFGVASDRVSRIQLWADDGTLRIEADQVRLQRQGQPDSVFPIAGPGSFVNEFEDFYHVLVEGKRPLMTVQDAVRDLEVITAAHRSVVEHRPMAVA